ncbi:peptidoglycan DD-metalloendopeptidase family protein [Patescibacteria group bacterium]|nr:peptidoglycan DD-metalloendopeptidase family protein [Patescibacteria group bacterium]
MENKKTNKGLYIILAVFLIANFLFPLSSLAVLTVQSTTDIFEQTDPQIQKLKEEIQQHQGQVDDLQEQQAAYEETLKIKRREINNLENQVGILETSMAKLALEIQTNELQIEQTELETQNLQLQIEHKKEQIHDQQKRMANILRSVNSIDRKKSHLEILVLEGSLGGFFKELNELQIIESNLKNDFIDLNQMKEELEDKKDKLEIRKKQLDSLHDKLIANKERLAGDKIAKNQLLNQTQGQEFTFQQLLADVKAEQAAIESEIQNLEVEARKRIMETQGILPTDDGFIWPISSRKITAYFHDPDYPFRYIFEHPAVDIGDTPQGTPIRVAKSGYVAKVKFDNTTNYGYILVVHTGGLSTVYGHISKPYVSEDDFVVQGEVIALSGGSPGTSGAGRLTTGPHLHFEVRLNGIPVNPLSYLP